MLSTSQRRQNLKLLVLAHFNFKGLDCCFWFFFFNINIFICFSSVFQQPPVTEIILKSHQHYFNIFSYFYWIFFIKIDRLSEQWMSAAFSVPACSCVPVCYLMTIYLQLFPCSCILLWQVQKKSINNIPLPSHTEKYWTEIEQNEHRLLSLGYHITTFSSSSKDYIDLFPCTFLITCTFYLLWWDG